MDPVEIFLIVGSIVISVLCAAILTCFLCKGCNRKAQTTRSLVFQTNFSHDDDDVEAQRETYNGYISGSPASRNSAAFTTSHWLHSNVQRSRLEPVASNSGARPKPVASNSGARPKPVASNSEARPSGNAQSSRPNCNHPCHDETLRKTHIINSSGNQTTRSSSNKTSNLPQQSGITSSDTRLPVSVMKPSQQEKGIIPSNEFSKYKELDLHPFQTLDQAMAEFKRFLYTSIEEYRNQKTRQNRYIVVIPGKGNHSKNKRGPQLKPAVEDYLNKHKYQFVHPKNNQGKVRIDLKSAR